MNIELMREHCKINQNQEPTVLRLFNNKHKLNNYSITAFNCVPIRHIVVFTPAETKKRLINENMAAHLLLLPR